MNTQNKSTLGWIIGIAAVGFIIYKLRKVKAKNSAVAENLRVAQGHYDQIQKLYGSVPKGGKLPENVLQQVVGHEVEIEKQGFVVENNKLVKKPVA